MLISLGSGELGTCRTINGLTVDGYKLYTLRDGANTDQTLRLDVSPGVKVYSFTFG